MLSSVASTRYFKPGVSLQEACHRLARIEEQKEDDERGRTLNRTDLKVYATIGFSMFLTAASYWIAFGWRHELGM